MIKMKNRRFRRSNYRFGRGNRRRRSRYATGGVTVARGGIRL